MLESNIVKTKSNRQSKKSIENISSEAFHFTFEKLRKNATEKCPFCKELFKERIKLLYHLCRNHLTERLCEGSVGIIISYIP